MTDPATGNVIVVNGEIYNHRALRALLGSEVNWRGTSDTETLLQGYARWGRDVVDHLKGMFAFAIYDAARKELFLARDRLGIKPLYYTMDADGLRAASEAKMLVTGRSHQVTARALSGYLQWGACPEGNLLYPGLQTLPAGHAATVGSEGELKTWRYWPSRKAFLSSTDNVTRQVRDLIDKAVDEHLLSDVPVASFLSGGIDSSIVTAIAAQKLEKTTYVLVASIWRNLTKQGSHRKSPSVTGPTIIESNFQKKRCFTPSPKQSKSSICPRWTRLTPTSSPVRWPRRE